MSITGELRDHGAVIKTLLDSITEGGIDCFYKLEQGIESRSSYILNVIPGLASSREKRLKIGFFVKKSRSRRSPWRYTFLYLHQVELDVLNDLCDEVFLVLIAGDDGMACVNYSELKLLLDDNFDEAEWVSLSRRLRESYRIAGKNGRLDAPLPMNSFPLKITKYISENFEG